MENDKNVRRGTTYTAILHVTVKRAARYLQTTTKHGENESFAKKIVSSQNTAKTVLLTIR